MYIEEVKHFMECVQKNIPPLSDISHAKMVLEIVIASKKASTSGVRQVFHE